MELRPEGHALRLFDPVRGEFLPTHREQAGVIEATKTKLAAAEARIKELEQRQGLDP